MTADPYVASGGPADPGSWNRYSYVGGDPVNRVDFEGLDYQTPGEFDPKDPRNVPPADRGTTVYGGTTDPVHWLYMMYGGSPASNSMREGASATSQAALDDFNGFDKNKRKIAGKIKQAAAAAFKAMAERPECAKLIGNNAEGIFSDLLRADPSVGFIMVDDIESAPGQVTSATTTGGNTRSVSIGNGASVVVAGFVIVTINDLAGSFVSGDTTSQAVTLLHELGHVLSQLYGPDASGIKDDAGNVNQSMANSAAVRKACFK